MYLFITAVYGAMISQHAEGILYTHENLSPQYSENMVTSVSSTLSAFVRSVAVHSMNTFRVASVILL